MRKWRRREHVKDLRTGPKEPSLTILSLQQEAVAVAFRRHTLLPLNQCLYALQATISKLTRLSLHRCFEDDSGRFKIDPLHQMPGLYNYESRAWTGCQSLPCETATGSQVSTPAWVLTPSARPSSASRAAVAPCASRLT